MCMNKRNEFGETYVYFSQTKRYLRLFKKICSFVNYVTLYVRGMSVKFVYKNSK